MTRMSRPCLVARSVTSACVLALVLAGCTGAQDRAAGHNPQAGVSGTPVPSYTRSPQHAAETLLDAYRQGQAFDATTQTYVDAAGEAPVELVEVLIEIFEAAGTYPDPSWRIALLEQADTLEPAVQGAPQIRAQLLASLAQLDSARWTAQSDAALERQGDAALKAYSLWGLWPQDFNDDLVADLDKAGDDARVRAWYGVYLVMAGVGVPEVEAELAAVAGGAAVASRERIEALHEASEGDS